MFNAKKELTQAIGAYGQIDYDYDSVGNRTQKTTDLVNIEDYIIDPNSNKLTAVNTDTLSQTFTYDGVGNVIEDNGFDSIVDTLTYSDNNRLTAFNSIVYGYNPFGQRVIENGKVNQYSGSDLIFVQDGTKTVEYIYLGDVKLAMIEKDSLGESIYYAINNYMGLPRAFTDNFGTIIWSGQFKPFGELYDEFGSVSNFIRFIGQYENVESEYFYNYFRDYAPALGRYIQSDPIGLNAGVNTYTYVLNNPINYIDPLGLIDTYIYDSVSDQKIAQEIINSIRVIDPNGAGAIIDDIIKSGQNAIMMIDEVHPIRGTIESYCDTGNLSINVSVTGKRIFPVLVEAVHEIAHAHDKIFDMSSRVISDTRLNSYPNKREAYSDDVMNNFIDKFNAYYGLNQGKRFNYDKIPHSH